MGKNVHRVGVPLFFLLGYLHTWLRVGPELAYHAQQPVFFEGWPYLAGFLGRPGGLAEYLGACLSQGALLPWLGALVVVAVSWLAYRLALAWAAATGGALSRGVALVPALLVLVLHNHYRHPLHLDLALLGAVAGALAYLRAPLHRAPARLVAFLVLAAAVWHAAATTLLFFAVLCAVGEATGAAPRRRGVACGVVGMPFALVLLAWALSLDPAQAWVGQLTPFRLYDLQEAPFHGLATILLYASYPALALAGALRRQRGHAPGEAGCASTRPRTGSARGWGVPRLATALGGPVLAIAPVVLTLDTQARTRLEIDHGARRGQWDQVVEAGAGLHQYSALEVYDIQQALYHVGALPERMFAFPLVANAPILMPSVEEPANLAALSHILFQLGNVNTAEHMAHEALEILGDRPWLLQRLTLINLAKGRTQAAHTFMGLLEKSPLYRDWVARLRRSLEPDSAQPEDEELARVRALMLRTDSPGYPTPEVLLRLLLVQNPHNRMAFEYLMAHYLLTGQLDQIARNIGHLNDFPGHYPMPTIPTHYEEALVLHLARLRSRPGGATSNVPLYGRRIRRRTVERFTSFRRALEAHPDDKDAARREAARSHGDTYWFYFAFRDALPLQAGAAPARPVNPQQ